MAALKEAGVSPKRTVTGGSRAAPRPVRGLAGAEWPLAVADGALIPAPAGADGGLDRWGCAQARATTTAHTRPPQSKRLANRRMQHVPSRGWALPCESWSDAGLGP